MSVKYIFNFAITLHLISAWGGAVIGGYETYTNRKECSQVWGSCPVNQNVGPRYFSASGDDLYSGSARGLIRGVYYPYKTLTHVPQIWLDEKPPWWGKP